MNQDGDQQSLAERLKKKVNEERNETEKILKESLQDLSKNSQALLQKELDTIESVIKTGTEEATENLNQYLSILSIAFCWKWIRSVIIGIAIIAGMILASWGVLQSISFWVNIKIDELDKIQISIQEQKQTLDYLKKDTFGLYLMEKKGGRFIVLPSNVRIKTDWVIGNRKAIQLVEVH